MASSDITVKIEWSQEYLGEWDRPNWFADELKASGHQTSVSLNVPLGREREFEQYMQDFAATICAVFGVTEAELGVVHEVNYGLYSVSQQGLWPGNSYPTQKPPPTTPSPSSPPPVFPNMGQMFPVPPAQPSYPEERHPTLGVVVMLDYVPASVAQVFRVNSTDADRPLIIMRGENLDLHVYNWIVVTDKHEYNKNEADQMAQQLEDLIPHVRVVVLPIDG